MRSPITFWNSTTAIASQFPDLTITDNLLELHNEANLFYLPNLGSKQTTLTERSIVGITI
jgi:hypothetical protein